MARAFTAADIIQSDDGLAVDTATPGVALPAGAGEGRTGLAVIGAGTLLDPPEQWHKVAACGQTAGNDQLGIMVRSDLPANEQAWDFTANGGGLATWQWLAQEWANIARGAPLAVLGTEQTSSLGPASYAIGPTDAADSALYVAEVAALLLLSTALSSTVWPDVSWSDGLVEVLTRTQGTGVWNGTSGDLRLHVARRFSTSPEAGPWETTATFTGSGSSAGKLVFGALAVLRAENFTGDI